MYCGPGKFVSPTAVVGASCTTCGAGQYSPDSGGCRRCRAGTRPNPTATACEVCPEDYISTDGVSCIRCDTIDVNYPRSSAQHTECLVDDVRMAPFVASVWVLVCFALGVAASVLDAKYRCVTRHQREAEKAVVEMLPRAIKDVVKPRIGWTGGEWVDERPIDLVSCAV